MDDLVERCEDIHRRIKDIARNDGLSMDAKMRAMALLLSLNAGIFPKLVEALHTRDRPGRSRDRDDARHHS